MLLALRRQRFETGLSTRPEPGSVLDKLPLCTVRVWTVFALWCCFAGACLTGSADAVVYSATRGPVRAALTERNNSGAGLTLRITRVGVTYVDRDFSPACAGWSGCQPVPDPYGARVISLRSANGKAEPDVFVHLSNGGNICCRSTVIYHYDSTTAEYRRSVHVWGDAADSGYPRSLGRSRQVFFVSENGRFRYEFGCGGCTPGPVQVWHDADGVLTDVTRSFPRLISKNSRVWHRLYLKQRKMRYGADGVLVAWVADKELLGQGRAAWHFLYQQGRGGYLTKPGSGFTRPAMFYKRLRHFLRKLGYLQR